MRFFFILLGILFSSHIIGQSNYGQKFLDYVVNTLPEQSYEFAKADYASKWALYFQTRIDQRNKILYQSLTTLDSIYREVDSFEKEYERLMTESYTLIDTIKLDIDRLKQSINIKQSLHDLESYLIEQERIVEEINMANTRENFLLLGMGHSGKERLLESVFQLGNDLELYATINYSVYINYSDENTSFGYKGYEDEFTGVIFSLGSYYPAASPYLMAVYALYDIHQREENRKQQKLVQEAMRLIDSKVIQPEAMYQLSCRMYEDQLSLRDSVIIYGEDLAIMLRKYMNLTQDFATKRFEVSSQNLTKGKIKYIQDSYSIDYKVRAIFQQRKLNSVIDYITNKYLETRIELNSFPRENLFDSIENIKRLEALEYRITYYKAVIEEWRLNPDLIPIANSFETIDSIYSDEIRRIQLLFMDISSNSDKMRKINSNSFQDYGIDSSILTAFSELSLPSFLPVETVEFQLEMNRLEDPSFSNYYYLNNTNSTYNLSQNYNTGLSKITYNTGKYPLQDILNGMADGGFSHAPHYSPSGVVDIQDAIGNIYKRISFMQNELYELNGWIEEWEHYNINSIKFNQENLAIIYSNFIFETRSVEVAWKSISSPSNIPLFHTKISQLSRLLYPGRNQVPVVPDNFPGLYLDALGRMKYEQYKKNRAIIKVRLRVLENRQNGIPDPVFTSNSDMEEIFQTMNSVSLNSSVYANPESQTCLQFPLACQDLSEQNLDQQILLRYYSMGWISKPTLNELSVLNPELYAQQIIRQLQEFEISCHDADPNANTPCNIYTSLALKKIYGVDEFYVYKDGKRNYMNANLIFDSLSRGADGWKLVGSANNQSTLDKAAFYANQGQIVVAVSKDSPNGHVAIVMPSIAIETSTLLHWKGLYMPKVTSFFIGKPEKSFFYKKMSFAWSSPSGVLIFVKNPYD